MNGLRKYGRATHVLALLVAVVTYTLVDAVQNRSNPPTKVEEVRELEVVVEQIAREEVNSRRPLEWNQPWWWGK